jgi:threonine/homoserine/homoserine lactone efflux protein
MKLLIAGFVLSLLGSLPDSSICSVAYIAIRRSFIAAMVLGTGAAFAEYFQALAAVALVGVIPSFKAIFEWVAAFVFLLSACTCCCGRKSPVNPMKLMKSLWVPILTEVS